MSIAIDRTQLERRVASLNTLIESHAGGMELAETTADGCVSIRYTGMCAGCDYRPLTTAGTVEPALLDVQGVTRVRVLGARVSEDALARIQATMEDSGAAVRAVQLVRRMEQGAPKASLP